MQMNIRDGKTARAAHIARYHSQGAFSGLSHMCARREFEFLQTTSKDIKMAGNSSQVTADTNIDTKRLSTAVVREALFRATREQNWTADDEWAFFLKQRFILCNNIAKANPAKNWENPQVGKDIDNAFKAEAKGRIPDWAESMIKYDKAVEWMRRQHWKNNKNKGPLASGLGGSTTGMSPIAGDRQAGVAPSAAEAGARDREGAEASGY
ncbi:hypothetical protein G7Y89_g5430 [Cudoniella acicularis]|uniref:Uncharacterized protein n=1 Tax=Cudoniella acicularis TaxID=354080 RepID=A0A8H4RNA9_9HELO|nr:hypothetical protein G7Y89_g5430 [Cudoniella acicularis]